MAKYEEEEENQLFASFNLLSCLDGFCLVVGSSGEVIFASNNIQNFVGLSSEEVLGQHLADFVHPCDQVAFLHYLATVNHNPFHFGSFAINDRFRRKNAARCKNEVLRFATILVLFQCNDPLTSTSWPKTTCCRPGSGCSPPETF